MLRRAMPRSFNRYAEAFLGGGALLLDCAFEGGLAGDSNAELVHFYEAARKWPNELINAASRMPITESDFYRVRALDPEQLEAVERAARFLYLNKTCYNGLHRVNRKGQFNTPFGGLVRVNMVDAANLMKAADMLRRTDLRCADYRDILNELEAGDFVYLDPPYYPIGGFSDFKRYTRDFFGEDEHAELAEEFEKLSRRGVLALMSNSAAARIEELYVGYPKWRVKASRQINCRPDGRGPITELIIANYPLGEHRGVS